MQAFVRVKRGWILPRHELNIFRIFFSGLMSTKVEPLNKIFFKPVVSVREVN